MDGKSRWDSVLGWVLSVGIHGVLLVGAGLVACLSGNAAGGVRFTGYACSIHEQGCGYDRIDRSQDVFNLGPPGPEPVEIHGCDGPADPGPDLEPILFRGGGAKPGEYASRWRSLQDCRTPLSPRRSSSARHALHVVGLEVDPDCPQCLQDPTLKRP